MDTAIVILNFNGKSWLQKFLPTVEKHSSKEADVFVIDNGSEDDSIEYLKKEHPSTHLVVIDKNLGYAGGYNKGLEQINYPYYVLLNSDIEVTENWINPIIQTFKKDPSIIAIQPKILSYNNKSQFEYAGAAGGLMDKLKYPFCRGRVFDHVEEDKQQFEKTAEIFWASGACLFIRSKDFHDHGGFDTDFFAHMEEIDLCWRIKNNGGKILYHPESKVYHVGGGTLTYNSPQKTFLNFRNSLFMIHKNVDSKLFRSIFTRLLLDGLAGLFFLSKGQFKHLFCIAKAHYAYFFSIGKLNKKRNKTPKRSYIEHKGVAKVSIVWEYYIKKNKNIPF